MALLKPTVLWTKKFWLNTLEAALLAGCSAGIAVIINTGVVHVNAVVAEQAGEAALVGAGYSLLKSFHITQANNAVKRGETLE